MQGCSSDPASLHPDLHLLSLDRVSVWGEGDEASEGSEGGGRVSVWGEGDEASEGVRRG